jgi:aspartate carbamoyltransferase catalytic subunit
VVGLLFFDPSTRTRFGFHAAAARLGGSAITLGDNKYQATMSAPESLEDTLRSVGAYCDVVVLRHAREDAVDIAAALLPVPVINAGNGSDEHPTQALIDLFAIRSWHGRLAGLRVGIVGDLRHSRAAHSLILALQRFEPREIRLLHPRGAELPESICEQCCSATLVGAGEFVHFDGLDALYFAGLPEGHDGTNDHRGPAIRRHFALTAETASRLSPSTLILDPLPRIDEIEPSIDALPNAGYFKQSDEAQHVRLAVLEAILRLGGTEESAGQGW